MKYKSVIVTQRGGPEVLQVAENDLRPPSAAEARIIVLAASVTMPEVQVAGAGNLLAFLLPFLNI